MRIIPEFLKLKLRIQMKQIKILLFLMIAFNISAQNRLYIRLNQVGYLPDETKNAVVMSLTPIIVNQFKIVKKKKNLTVFTGYLKKLPLKSGKFRYLYSADFSPVKSGGEYYLKIGSNKSYSFKIGKSVYNSIIDSLMLFFKVQRCGYTSPYLHKVCHIADATSLIINGKEIKQKYDVTGGWHDAGDYIKFMNTTAFTTYMLLFAYDFDPIKFGFDDDGDNTPDVLAEAKIGLDWMLRAVYRKYKLITQVQTLKDHDVGWRMPENDPLTFNRPAFVGIGKNLIGIFTATMSLAARIWRIRFHYDEFAEKCLTAAENIYSVRNDVTDIDSSGTGMYIDAKYKGKMALGAIELYFTSRRPRLLEEAKKYAASAGSDYWWSWGDVNSLADYRLATIDTSFVKYLRNNLIKFEKDSRLRPFGEAIDYTWGTTNTLLGVTLQNILYENLTGDHRFDSVATIQKDYILGRNPWGISFIGGIGKVYPIHFHHQIAFLKNRLPGALAAGPIKRKVYKSYKIHFNNYDRFSLFQPDSVVYYDDKNDYLTNEPTIVSNATAVFVFGNLTYDKLKFKK